MKEGMEKRLFASKVQFGDFIESWDSWEKTGGERS